MTTENRPDVHESVDSPNGAALAAFLGAGFGAFAMGVFVILNEAGVFPAPTLYGPAGGVSGRTTLAVVSWLVGWGLLHLLWRRRQLRPRPVYATTLVLIALGVIASFPPVWGLF